MTANLHPGRRGPVVLSRLPVRRRSRSAVGLLLVALLAMIGTIMPARPAAAGPIIIPLIKPIVTMARGIQSVTSVAKGPDGNLWFISAQNDSIGRVTPTGVIAMFGSTGVSQLESITAGPDGNLWFTSAGNNRIGRITPAGVISTFTSAAVNGPRGITKAADGALWFTQSDNSIGRITTAGAITAFTGGPGVVSNPGDIVAGNNNDLWFVNRTGDSIGHLIGVVGGLAAIVKVTSGNEIDDPESITMGPDGNVWFTNLIEPSIGKLVPNTGDVTEYATDAVSPTGIVAGPNNELWFSGRTSHDLWKISTLGTISPVADTAHTGVYPTDMALMPDGNVWYGTAQTIGRATPLGVTTQFRTGIEGAGDITTGPDGNLWFANQWGIERLSLAGAKAGFTKNGLVGVSGITTGADGNLWFTDRDGNHIGRSTPAGVITLFSHASLNGPSSITAGPDGNVWFTNSKGKSIGRITPAGVITAFPNASFEGPDTITAGPDGNLWFADNYANQIGRITPAGVITFFTDPSLNHPRSIIAAPDGNLWFTNAFSVGRVTPAGVITDLPTGTAEPGEMVVGADGNLWFAFYDSPTQQGFGRMTLQGSQSYIVKAGLEATSLVAAPDGNVWFTTTHGTVGRLTVAPQRFSDVPVGSPFYADINWLVSEGIASGYPDGTFKPTAPVTRQAMAAFLYRFDGSSLGTTPPCPDAPFPDVPVGAPFCGEITWLADHGIAGGFADGGFHPTANVSRQAMAAFLYRLAAGGTPPPCTQPPFEDVATTDTFCGEITWAAQHGIITGYSDGTFQKANPVTRQAMAAFLHRLDIYLNP